MLTVSSGTRDQLGLIGFLVQNIPPILMWTILLHASRFDVGSTGDSGPFASFVAAARFLQRGISSSSLSSLSSEDMEHGRATSSGSNGTRAAIAEGGLTRVIFFVGCSGSRVNGVRHARSLSGIQDVHSGTENSA